MSLRLEDLVIWTSAQLTKMEAVEELFPPVPMPSLDAETLAVLLIVPQKAVVAATMWTDLLAPSASVANVADRTPLLMAKPPDCDSMVQVKPRGSVSVTWTLV